MPYFSNPLPTELVRNSGSLTRFQTVIHKNNQICTEAAERVRDEFNEAMKTDIVPRTVAEIPGLGRMHAVAFTIPNCLPERLAVLTRFAEFTILNDGKQEISEKVGYTNLTLTDFYDIAKNEEVCSIILEDSLAIGNATES